MKNRLGLKLVVTIMFATTLFISCENEGFDPDAAVTVGSNALARKFLDSSNTTFVTNLMAGQHHLAGTVTISKDDTNLEVTYETNTDTISTKNWTIKTTHLYVGDCKLIPTTKAGNPKIGRFPYKADHAAGTTSFTYTIPLDSIEGDCFCVAAHAVVDCSTETTTTTPPVAPVTPVVPVNPIDPGVGSKASPDKGKGKDKDKGKGGATDTGDDSCGEETAWAEGQGFPGNSWAMFVELCETPDPDPTPNPTPIPVTPVNPTPPSTEG